MDQIERLLLDESDITNGPRVLRAGGESFDTDFPKAEDFDKRVADDGDVDDTVKVMQQVVQSYNGDCKAIAQTLRRDTVDATCRAIWEFLYYNIQYKNDVKGIE